MSRTLHHRKPGEPRKPQPRYIPEGRTTTAMRNAMLRGGEDLPTHEQTSHRRTR